MLTMQARRSYRAGMDTPDSRHQTRMQRLKSVVDDRISRATQQRGVLIVNTGNGKGKSSAAFGLLARALGHGQKAGVVQFIKGRGDTGEETFFRRFPEVEWVVAGEGFTWETQDKSRDIAAAENGWEAARRMLSDPSLQLVVLDELNIALKLHYLDLNNVLADLARRPASQNVVITGRGAPNGLIEAADTVTDMGCTRHAFSRGIAAQAGVEW